MRTLLLTLILTASFALSQNRPTYKNLQDSVFKKGDLVKIPEIVYEGSVPCCFGKQKDSIKPIADFINKNKGLIVEIGCHSAHQNLTGSKSLSGFRAEKVWHYLVFDLKVDSNRVKRMGYGSTKPIVSKEEISKAKTKEEKEKLFQMNNRTELKILETNYWDYSPAFIDKKSAVQLQRRKNQEPNQTQIRNKFIIDSTFFVNNTNPKPEINHGWNYKDRVGSKGHDDIYHISPELKIISDSSVFVWPAIKDSSGYVYDKNGQILIYHGRARPSRAPKLKFTNLWVDTMYLFIPQETDGVCPAQLEVIMDNGDTLVEDYNFANLKRLDYTLGGKKINIYFLVPSESTILEPLPYGGMCTYEYRNSSKVIKKWSPPEPIGGKKETTITPVKECVTGTMRATVARPELTTDKRFWNGNTSTVPIKVIFK